MKSLLTFAVSAALAVPGLPLFAQLQDNTERQLTCENGGHDGDNVRHCEIREQTYPSIGRLNVDEVRNGAVSVKGALRGDVLVRARVETQREIARHPPPLWPARSPSTVPAARCMPMAPEAARTPRGASAMKSSSHKPAI